MITRGSKWRRWEPHIHAPGTVLNDQFSGPTAWEDYLKRIEESSPRIEALAVTDYYLTNTYETVREHKENGRLPDVKRIFPNVEMRLDVRADRGFVNIHLLVSPEDPKHLEELDRFLRRLEFRAYEDTFNCTRNDLIKLGKKAKPEIKEDNAALREGATQFKVNLTKLRDVLSNSGWARDNILVAVAGSSKDGSSGLQEDAAVTLRREIERFADIIFSSSPAQRDFWLGYKGVSAEELKQRYGGCKPCLHGSDAHDQDAVAKPHLKRYSWIKGELDFDALRQACIDPENRAYVGEDPPKTAMLSQVISSVSVANADWIITPEIPLNPGLVAIIGARGSGKTALADIIATGCDAIPAKVWNDPDNLTKDASFLRRAQALLSDARVTLNWGGGATTDQPLDGTHSEERVPFPRARYLSQQFVEELCSSGEKPDGLISEIERVIFDAHPIDDREGATKFGELRDLRTDRFIQNRASAAAEINELSAAIASEMEKEKSVAGREAEVKQLQARINGYLKDRDGLIVKGSEAKANRHAEVTEALEKCRGKILGIKEQKRSVIALQDQVKDTREKLAPGHLRKIKTEHQRSGLSDAEWQKFLLIFQGDVDTNLAEYVKKTDAKIAELTGQAVDSKDNKTALIADDADLSTLPLNTLKAEQERLSTMIGADRLVQQQYGELTNRITKEQSNLKELQRQLADAKSAKERRSTLNAKRMDAYHDVFAATIKEQKALEELYKPLMDRLASESGTLGKLGFRVTRTVDTRNWAGWAERQLLDLRKTGQFQGQGSLVKIAQDTLHSAWEKGSADDIKSAMTAFIANQIPDLLKHAPYSPDQVEKYKEWLAKFSKWLFNTAHISVTYEIVYDGTDIRKLSPGTRGIVLLLLYLALDDVDDRPLIIDQPEENLDPKSVFDELVSLFIKAKTKRQVIMVTHNANLVVNTDADQVIIAEAGPNVTGGLPPITYRAGGLDNADIRKSVCEILEGGEEAFRQRARRLRVPMPS